MDPPVKFPDARKLEIDDTVSVDIWLFPYASICPVLIDWVLIDPVVKLEVLRFVALIVVVLMVDALTFVKFWTANGVRVVI